MEDKERQSIGVLNKAEKERKMEGQQKVHKKKIDDIEEKERKLIKVKNKTKKETRKSKRKLIKVENKKKINK